MNDDSYEQELREYGYSQRERREFDSPSPTRERRLDSRDSSPTSFTVRRSSSTHERQFDYDDRYSDRYSRFKDTDSQSGDVDSVRSESRREYRDRYNYDEKFQKGLKERKTSKDTRSYSPASSDYSQSVSSHGGYHSRSASPTEKRQRRRQRTPVPNSPEDTGDFTQPFGCTRAHSPTDLEDYTKIRDKKKKYDIDSDKGKYLESIRTKSASSIKTRDSSGEFVRSKKVNYDSDSSNSDLSDTEKRIRPDSDKGAAKRLRNDSFDRERLIDGLDSIKRVQRQHSNRSLSSSGSRTKLKDGDLMDYEISEKHKPHFDKPLLKRTSKLEEGTTEERGRPAYEHSPQFSPDSDQDSNYERESIRSQSSVDLTKLQKEKYKLMLMLKQLDTDGGASASDNDSGAMDDELRRAKKCRLEDIVDLDRDPRLQR
jgi:hypothetical protein